MPLFEPHKLTLGSLCSKAQEIANLVEELRPFYDTCPKAKVAKIGTSHL